MHIELEIKNYRCFPDSRPARLNLQKGFTALIGANNSGKSSILKFFYELRPLFGRLSSQDGFFTALRERTSLDRMPSVFDFAELFSNKNDRDIEITITVKYDEKEQSTLAHAPVETAFGISIKRNAEVACKLAVDGKPLVSAPAQIDGRGWFTESSSGKISRFDGLLEVFKSISQMLYVGPFRNILNFTGADYFGLKIGQQFIVDWREYKTGYNKQNNETAVRLTEDIRRIFGFQSLDINSTPDNQTLALFVDGKSYKLTELGSGISQFIVVLVGAAMQKPSFILIDEPEANLHPALQLDFLTTLASYAREGVWFATHSLGLARSSANRIYSFRRTNEGESAISEYEATSRLSAFLGELSFPAYRELGFSKVLLVEGTTDVTTIQQFLRFYQKDHQVVLLPLGGSQLINGSSELELSEIQRISNHISAIIDSEKNKSDDPLSKDRAAFVESCKTLGIPCHVLTRRAIENYLTEDAIRVILGPKYSALGPYEKLSDVALGWAKAENWRIARQMTESDITGTDLGDFLSRL